VGNSAHLYYEDSYRTAFTARVVAHHEHEGRPAVVLDGTFFYPTSGGQPHDTGTLGGVAVVEVVEAEGEILHVLAAPLPLGPVEGKVHWARRFDHMQQHSGQHLLSQAFERALGAATVSFHLGSASSTIDLDTPTLDAEAVARVEDLANSIVLENRAMLAREYDEREVGTLGLRKLPVVTGRIRVVSVADFDACACGGTHVHAAGEIGCIHIRGWERRRNQVRVEFLCGWRALHDYRARDAVAQGLASKLSVAVEEIPASMARLAEAEQAARHEAGRLRTRLIELELPALAAAAEPWAGARVLCRMLEGYDAANMRYVAQNLTQQPGMVLLLGVTEPTPQFCFARAAEVTADMGKLLSQALGRYGGRGGGKAQMAQGGGVTAEQAGAVLEEAQRLLRVALGG
jgi:alanyl-tRNA synthetase